MSKLLAAKIGVLNQELYKRRSQNWSQYLQEFAVAFVDEFAWPVPRLYTGLRP